MKITFQLLSFVALFCAYNFQQQTAQPFSKWAFAQSYSWVVSNNGYNVDTISQQSHQDQVRFQQLLSQQQAMQQQEMIQQARIQQQAQIQQQQTLQLQARQAQIQDAIQKQALQEANTQQQLHPHTRENSQLQGRSDQHNLPNTAFTVPNKFDGQPSSNFQTVPNLSSNSNEYTQEFIDEIVRKVIQEANGKFALPTTRIDIEKIVRKILFENQSNSRQSNQMARYSDNERDVNNNQNFYNNYPNRNGLPDTFYPQKLITYPVRATEPLNSQAECLFNCGNSQVEGQPIAVAMANSIYSLNRSTDPQMATNSFSYTSV